MAEVRKNKKIEKYDITDKLDSKVEKKKNVVKKETNKEEKKNTNNKQSLWVRFRIFCHGVASEFICISSNFNIKRSKLWINNGM